VLNKILRVHFAQKFTRIPFLLPCDDTLCEEHLKEASVRKTNSITCKTCQIEFAVKDNQMIRPSKAMQKLIENERYLSDEEKSLKKQLEQALRDFLNLNEQLQDAKNSFDLDCHNHFQEIRRKIDVQREELKDQIDKIALAMIEQTKEMEQKHLTNSNKFKVDVFDLDKEKKILDETFRDVNLSIESIKELKSKQDETVSSIKSKINEIDQWKKVVIKLNDFDANLSFNRDSFGSLALNESSILQFDSKILSQHQIIDLIKLCEFNSDDNWALLYRGSRDGFGAEDFHLKCDNKSPTLTIIKAQESGYIFGGYTEAAWDSTYKFQVDPNVFLFSLTNKDNKPCKMNVTDPTRAIYCDLVYGPIFCGGSEYFDIDILVSASHS
jgi:DNA repair exonuclease SbcCD ATPase subunit